MLFSLSFIPSFWSSSFCNTLSFFSSFLHVSPPLFPIPLTFHSLVLHVFSARLLFFFSQISFKSPPLCSVSFSVATVLVFFSCLICIFLLTFPPHFTFLFFVLPLNLHLLTSAATYIISNIVFSYNIISLRLTILFTFHQLFYKTIFFNLLFLKAI